MFNHLNGKTGKILAVLQITSLCILILVQSKDTSSSQNDSPETIPDWLEKKMTIETKGTGKWIAVNPHKSEKEPIDAYGMEYKWGAGEKSLTFRLFAVTNQKESATIWDYREFWHPGEKKVLVYQWGSDGTFGFGEVRPVDIAHGKFELEQTFFDPNGTSWKSRHETIETETERQTKSFIYQDGNWKEGGTYTWRHSD